MFKFVQCNFCLITTIVYIPKESVSDSIQDRIARDFPGGPAVNSSPSIAGSVSSISRWGAKITYDSQPKTKQNKTKQNMNRRNIVTNSIRIFKMIYIKKEKNPHLEKNKITSRKETESLSWLWKESQMRAVRDRKHKLYLERKMDRMRMKVCR